MKYGGGQNLFALSCEESGYAGSKIGVDTIYLVSLQDYNNTYSKNDTLNEIALTNYWTSSVDDFNNFFPLTDYIDENKDNIQRGFFEIKLTEPPIK